MLLGFDLVMSRLYPNATITTQAGAPDTPAAQAALPASQGGTAGIGMGPGEPLDLASALAQADRIEIDAPEVAGSINPVGARVDDIMLKTHRQTVDEDS